MARLFLSLLTAAIALTLTVLSVQNATPVAIRFLTLRSVALPFGVWLGVATAAGLVGTALLLALGGRPRRS